MSEARDSSRPWWYWRVYPGDRKPKYGRHPLCVLAGEKCFGEREALNWLQERGYISDQAMRYDDVAPVDVARVLTAAGRLDLLPEQWVAAFALEQSAGSNSRS